MPRGVRKAPSRGPLADLRAKLREAEKALRSAGFEKVALSEASYEMLLELVTRGIGKKTEVLKDALRTGLEVLFEGTRPVSNETPFLSPAESVVAGNAIMPPPALRVVGANEIGFGRGTLGVGAPTISQPILEPAAQEPEGDEGDEQEAAALE